MFNYNVRLIIEYNGSSFHGWQKQPGLRTVQGELERALSLVIKGKVSHVQAAGRTDSGVHAKNQCVNFKTDVQVDLNRLKHSVSSILKGDLAVKEALYVPLEFNALRAAKAREYVYTMLIRAAPPVLDKGKVWHITFPLNIERMVEQASYLVGRYDFTSFRGADCMNSSPIKEVIKSDLIVDGDYIIYKITGKGFLKQMVRIIVGTLVWIGKGHPESILNIIERQDRRAAGMTAPAFGLCLENVIY